MTKHTDQTNDQDDHTADATPGEDRDIDRRADHRPHPLSIGARVRVIEPRDWSNYVEPLGIHARMGQEGLDFIHRCHEFLDEYDRLRDAWRYSIAQAQDWRCYYADPNGHRTLLRTFGPVVHQGIECDDHDSARGCYDREHHVVACMNHASALNDRTDAELREAMQGKSILAKCLPIALLPSGHGWCGTGISNSDYDQFRNPNYRPGGWGGIGDDNAFAVYGWETSLFGR